MKKIISSIFKPVVDFSALLFPYFLIFYLVLFLLENLFTGFVSNIFELNNLLIPVLISGFFGAFAPEKKQEIAAAGKSDYTLAAIMSIAAFGVLFYKTRDQGTSGVIISLAGAVLTGFISVILLKPDTEPMEEDVLPELSGQRVNDAKSRQPFMQVRYLFRKKFLFAISLGALLITGFFLYKDRLYDVFPEIINKNKDDVQTKKNVTDNKNLEEQIPQEEYIPGIEENEFGMWSEGVDIATLEKTPITIVNSGASSIVLNDVLKILIENKCAILKVVKDEDGIYNNAVIKFNPEDWQVAEYISRLLKNHFPSIEKAPLGNDESGILLILGPIK